MKQEGPVFTPRLEGLDALRGFALFGLFIVHMPELFELYWAHPATDPAQLIWHNVIFTLFAGKAFALLALCFGVSFFIIMDRSAHKGVDFTGRFIWRLAVLFLIGCAHAIWYRGDVLGVLAVMGLFLLPFYRLRSNALVAALGVLFLLQPLIWVQIISGLSGADWANQPLRFWSANIPEAYLSGTFPETIAMNITDGYSFKWLFMYESGRLSQILGLSLMGMVLGRIGFFREPARFSGARLAGLMTALIAALALYHSRGAITDLMPASETMFMPKALFGSVVSSLFDLSVMTALMLGFLSLYYSLAHKALMCWPLPDG